MSRVKKVATKVGYAEALVGLGKEHERGSRCIRCRA